MAERMTSPEEAAILKAGLDAAINALERDGFGRGQIGAAMAGVGLALTQVHQGHATAIKMVECVRDQLLADAATKQ